MFSRLFRSRWAALLWAGGMLWTAYDVVGMAPAHPTKATAAEAAPTDATGEPVNATDLMALAHAAP